jgi:uncharacterized protein YegL
MIPRQQQSIGAIRQPSSYLSAIRGPMDSGNRGNALVVKQEWSEIDNPYPRIPCVIVADASGSMEGQPIHSLNEGFRTLGECLRRNNVAARSAEIAIVRVGRPLEVFTDFTPADRFHPEALCAYGDTPLAEGILTAIRMTEERLHQYDVYDFDWFRPWILAISDGLPNRSDAIAEAIREIRRVERQRSMSVFVVGVNSQATRKLREFTDNVAELDRFDFDRLFRWVSKQIIQVSQTTPGEEPPLPDLSEIERRQR